MADTFVDGIRLSGFDGQSAGDGVVLMGTKVDNTLTKAGQAADAKTVGDALASIDNEVTEVGESLSEISTEGTVPTSEQMLSDNYTEDSVPYHFRMTASDNADREELEIVGGSVAWNQLVQTSSTSVTVTSGHKYYANINGTKTIGTSTGTAISINDGTEDNVVDLTQALGSTIADHIYSLEQATAGAGVALFKSLFPKDYYAYDAGSIQSVSGLSAHRITGFNQWDEEYLVGYYTSTGEYNSGATDQLCTKNLIPVIPNSTYYFKVGNLAENVSIGAATLYYDASGNFIERVTGTKVGDQIIPDGIHYIRVNFGSAYGKTYNHDICINISDPAKNGQYEPYQKHSYALDDSLTLRGVPTLVDGKIKWDGDVYSADGKVTRRYGIVDLGTLTWSTHATQANLFYATVPYMVSTTASALEDRVKGIISAKYPVDSQTALDTSVMHDKTMLRYTNSRLFIYDSDYTDVSVFKTSLSGVYLVYELATPTTETADPYIGIQSCHYDGTEEFVSTEIVPVGHNTRYPDNLRMKLDNLPWNFANLIAPTESGFKATRNYTTGALLIVNNTLYKATANIANGGTITVGTNVAATTLAEVISALS